MSGASQQLVASESMKTSGWRVRGQSVIASGSYHLCRGGVRQAAKVEDGAREVAAVDRAWHG